MAKGRVLEWLEEDKLKLLEGWARNGLTNEQIAKNIGVNPKTIYDWMNKEPKIKQALKKGKEVVDLEVENALFKRAIGYTITIMEQKIDKDGMVHDVIRDVHVPGDVTAQIFWLKNRKKHDWRDKVEYETNSDELNKVKELINKIEQGAKNE